MLLFDGGDDVFSDCGDGDFGFDFNRFWLEYPTIGFDVVCFRVDVQQSMIQSYGYSVVGIFVVGG